MKFLERCFSLPSEIEGFLVRLDLPLIFFLFPSVSSSFSCVVFPFICTEKLYKKIEIRGFRGLHVKKDFYPLRIFLHKVGSGWVYIGWP